MMRYFIEDFIEESNACSTREEAFALYQKAIKKLGYTSAVYTFVTDHLEAGQTAGHGVQCNFPDHWMQYYVQQGYQPVDPVILRVKQTARSFTWRQLKEEQKLTGQQCRILSEAQESGLLEGVGIPLHGPRGELAGAGLASDVTGLQPTPGTLAQLQWLTEQFHWVYCALGSQSAEIRRPELTAREVEILQWLAIGKTDHEIAMILNCEAQTVRWHLKNIYSKLNANSKTLAVTKAIYLGIITLDTIRVS